MEEWKSGLICGLQCWVRLFRFQLFRLNCCFSLWVRAPNCHRQCVHISRSNSQAVKKDMPTMHRQDNTPPFLFAPLSTQNKYRKSYSMYFFHHQIYITLLNSAPSMHGLYLYIFWKFSGFLRVFHSIDKYFFILSPS